VGRPLQVADPAVTVSPDGTVSLIVMGPETEPPLTDTSTV
jgi:hypothetical protein